MGAWIETYDTVDDVDNSTSHPMWVRGLKHCVQRKKTWVAPSHPMWVRGLKQSVENAQKLAKEVAPYVGAWIETKPYKHH